MFSPSDWLSIAIFAVAAVATVLGSYVAARGGGRSGSMEGAGGGSFDEALADHKLYAAENFLLRREYERQRDRRDKELDDIRAEMRGSFLSLRSEIERDMGIFRERLDYLLQRDRRRT